MVNIHLNLLYSPIFLALFFVVVRTLTFLVHKESPLDFFSGEVADGELSQFLSENILKDVLPGHTIILGWPGF